jgi:zinc transport system substrate-binding protein
MERFFRVLGMAVVGVILSVATFLATRRDETSLQSSLQKDKLRIATTFYPIGEFARRVVGDAAEVSVIVSTGIEPHEYEPTPRDIASMYAADIVLVNGAGLDAWATKIRPELEAKGVDVVVMSQALGFDDGSDAAAHGEGEGLNPHFWLDPSLAQNEVAVMAKTFARIDTKHADEYAANAETYGETLRELDRAYRDRLAVCENRIIMVSHDAFGYLAKAYDFETLAIAGFSPESEPSTRQLADLATLARQKNIRHIFFETLVSPRLAQTLASEIGAETLVFHPLEGLTDEEIAQGKDYISVMRENLNNLRIAMDCYGQ